MKHSHLVHCSSGKRASCQTCNVPQVYVQCKTKSAHLSSDLHRSIRSLQETLLPTTAYPYPYFAIMSDISSPFKSSPPRRNSYSNPPVHHSGAQSSRFCRTTGGATLYVLLFSFLLFCVSSRLQAFFSSVRLSPVFLSHPAKEIDSYNSTRDRTPQSQSQSQLQSCHLANSSYHSLSIPTNAPAVLRDYAVWHKQQRACLLDAQCKRKPKLFVFRCPKHGWCLGLGDRMRGVLFSLFYAIITQRLFIIAWPDEPYPLQVALPPASIDWTPPANFSMHRKWPHLDLTYCHKTRNCNWREPLVLKAQNIEVNGTSFNTYTDDLNAIFGHPDAISVSLRLDRRYFDKTFYVKDMFSGLDNTKEDYGTMEQEVYRMMFKPSEKVLHKMKSVGFKDDESYYGVHIRTGVDVNETDEKRFDYINSHLDLTVESIVDCLEIVGGKTAPRRVFLAADSTEAKNVFLKKTKERGFDVKVFEKETIHFLKVNLEEQTFDDMCDRYLTIFADLYMLSRSRILVSTGSHFPDFAHTLAYNMNSTHIRYIPEYEQTPQRICKPSKQVV